MNQQLWNRILEFDLDNPPSEYGFSTRLANENYWTIAFTEKAILEYKKFMYLAASSDFMVSPSEIVDTVWHQHLIFTQSYQDFCNLIGKQIQHIPSTYNKEDYQKFQHAKERTTKFYERDFGLQPKDIWHYNDMFSSLNLKKAKFKIRSFLIFGILAFICLIAPAYFLLQPVYIKIDNPYFLISCLILTFITIATLELYNRYKLKEIVSHFDRSSFVFELQPFELIYLKTQSLSHVINGTINELVENETINIGSTNTIELLRNGTTENKEQLQTITTLYELGETYYPALLKKLMFKPIFWNIPNSMDAFQKYFNKSKRFGLLFYTNFIVLTILLLFSFTRIVTGIIRDKPVFLISITTIVIGIITYFFLQRLTRQVCTTTIPEVYKMEILPNKQIENNWQWSYFLFGAAVLSTSFAPLIKYPDRSSDTAASSGTSCGSSCGSSCSSCGGCGGGD